MKKLMICLAAASLILIASHRESGAPEPSSLGSDMGRAGADAGHQDGRNQGSRDLSDQWSVRDLLDRPIRGTGRLGDFSGDKVGTTRTESHSNPRGNQRNDPFDGSCKDC